MNRNQLDAIVRESDDLRAAYIALDKSQELGIQENITYWHSRVTKRWEELKQKFAEVKDLEPLENL
jgi:uncharacterized protein HemX